MQLMAMKSFQAIMSFIAHVIEVLIGSLAFFKKFVTSCFCVRHSFICDARLGREKFFDDKFCVLHSNLGELSRLSKVIISKKLTARNLSSALRVCRGSNRRVIRVRVCSSLALVVKNVGNHVVRALHVPAACFFLSLLHIFT